MHIMIRFIPPFLNRTSMRAALLVSHVALALGVLALAPVHSVNAELAPGHSAIGNYLAGRHAQKEKDLGSAVTFLSAALRALPEAPDLLRRTFVLMTIEGKPLLADLGVANQGTVEGGQVRATLRGGTHPAAASVVPRRGGGQKRTEC